MTRFDVRDVKALWELSQDGIIRSATLLDLGFTGSTITYRCRSGGPWQRVLLGVVLLHGGPISQRQRLVAALMYGGPDSALTGHPALALFGVPGTAGRSSVPLLVPDGVRRQSRGFVTVERTTRMPQPLVRQGLAVTPPRRAALDAGRRMTDRNECVALLASVVQRGLATVAELMDELETGSNHGSAIPRLALKDIHDGAHSVPEVLARRLHARSGLPSMIANCDILTAGGEFIARPDGWFDDVGLAWEIDSLAHHLAVDDHVRTQLRRQHMQRHGIIVVSHIPRTLRDDPTLVIADLQAGYALASQHPRPSVRMA